MAGLVAIAGLGATDAVAPQSYAPLATGPQEPGFMVGVTTSMDQIPRWIWITSGVAMLGGAAYLWTKRKTKR
jgi:hypothetical protein